ncbi:MAG: hypothetical protein WC890_07850 [Candidatus Margulisiibacteriota bacterium]
MTANVNQGKIGQAIQGLRNLGESAKALGVGAFQYTSQEIKDLIAQAKNQSTSNQGLDGFTRRPISSQNIPDSADISDPSTKVTFTPVTLAQNAEVAAPSKPAFKALCGTFALLNELCKASPESKKLVGLVIAANNESRILTQSQQMSPEEGVFTANA